MLTYLGHLNEIDNRNIDIVNSAHPYIIHFSKFKEGEDGQRSHTGRISSMNNGQHKQYHAADSSEI